MKKLLSIALVACALSCTAQAQPAPEPPRVAADHPHYVIYTCQKLQGAMEDFAFAAGETVDAIRQMVIAQIDFAHVREPLTCLSFEALAAIPIVSRSEMVILGPAFYTLAARVYDDSPVFPKPGNVKIKSQVPKRNSRAFLARHSC